MNDIAFLAIAQAHQHPHWLPVALRLSRVPGVRVTVLSSSRAALAFIRSYDPERRMRTRWLPVPTRRRDGLFSPPRRRLTLRLYHRYIGSFPTIVTTETTSSLLKRYPSFKSRLVEIKHGAGDREGGYKDEHRHFDLILVAGKKDRQRLIERGLATSQNCVVCGYAKFELDVPNPPLFADDKPLALYNPHFDPAISSWFAGGQSLVAAMERIAGWNFIVAPHVRLRGGPKVTGGAANIRIDGGSRRSIDMSYTNAAYVYVGDASSQVYEFVRTPRPCIFLNLERTPWRDDERYQHWHFGQVIEDIAQVGPALDRAAELQSRYEPLQQAALAQSIDPSPTPASDRQAQAILDFIRSTAP